MDVEENITCHKSESLGMAFVSLGLLSSTGIAVSNPARGMDV
jgi:hypothetical protein